MLGVIFSIGKSCISTRQYFVVLPFPIIIRITIKIFFISKVPSPQNCKRAWSIESQSKVHILKNQIHWEDSTKTLVMVLSISKSDIFSDRTVLSLLVIHIFFLL